MSKIGIPNESAAPAMVRQAPMQHHVVFATPAFDFNVSSDHKLSTISTERLLMAHGIAVSHMSLDGDAYLAKVRSKMATKFLEDYPTAQKLFFIDADVGGWEPQKALEFIIRHEPVLAGVYPKKCDNIDFPCVLLGDRDNGGGLIRQNGLVAASMVPTGFLCIHRSVLEKVAAQSKKFWSTHDTDLSRQRLYTEVFKMGVDRDGGDWVGEDPWFCREIIAMGIDIWVDDDISFSHQGTKKWKRKLREHIEECKVPVLERAAE